MTRRSKGGFTRGEYLNVGHHGDDQTVNARQYFVGVVRDVVPGFFEELQSVVYPRYVACARRVRGKPSRGAGHWQTGWYLSTWEAQLGRSNFKSILLTWAERFGCAEEAWILEGALESMSAWYRVPGIESGDLRRFCRPIAGNVLVDYEPFSFEDRGWSPQFERWAEFRRRIEVRFTEELGTYQRRTRGLIESKKGRRAQRRISRDNFKWFVLYQIRGMSLSKIEDLRGSDFGDESTVRKGIRAAARLLGWTEIRDGRRLTSASGK